MGWSCDSGWHSSLSSSWLCLLKIDLFGPGKHQLLWASGFMPRWILIFLLCIFFFLRSLLFKGKHRAHCTLWCYILQCSSLVFLCLFLLLFCLFSCLFSFGKSQQWLFLIGSTKFWSPLLFVFSPLSAPSTVALVRVGCVCRPSEGVAQPSNVVVLPSSFWSRFAWGLVSIWLVITAWRHHCRTHYNSPPSPWCNTWLYHWVLAHILSQRTIVALATVTATTAPLLRGREELFSSHTFIIL